MQFANWIGTLRSLATACLWLSANSLSGQDFRHAPGGNQPDAPPPRQASLRAPTPGTAKLPPLPKGVTELKFSDFFVMPVGPRGLEFSEKLRALDGQRVRILGHMVRQASPVPGEFLLAPLPVQVDEEENGLADDLPPSTLHVISPSHGNAPVAFTPQLLLLTGRLQVGNHPGPGGRISPVRLTLDPVRQPSRFSPAPGKGAERLATRPAAHGF